MQRPAPTFSSDRKQKEPNASRKCWALILFLSTTIHRLTALSILLFSGKKITESRLIQFLTRRWRYKMVFNHFNKNWEKKTGKVAKNQVPACPAQTPPGRALCPGGGRSCRSTPGKFWSCCGLNDSEYVQSSGTPFRGAASRFTSLPRETVILSKTGITPFAIFP